MLNVTILSPQEEVFKGRAYSLVFPGAQGVFEVLPFHHTLVSLLLPGIILVEDRAIGIRRGVVKIERDLVTVIIEPDPL